MLLIYYWIEKEQWKTNQKQREHKITYYLKDIGTPTKNNFFRVLCTKEKRWIWLNFEILSYHNFSV